MAVAIRETAPIARPQPLRLLPALRQQTCTPNPVSGGACRNKEEKGGVEAPAARAARCCQRPPLPLLRFLRQQETGAAPQRRILSGRDATGGAKSLLSSRPRRLPNSSDPFGSLNLLFGAFFLLLGVLIVFFCRPLLRAGPREASAPAGGYCCFCCCEKRHKGPPLAYSLPQLLHTGNCGGGWGPPAHWGPERCHLESKGGPPTNSRDACCVRLPLKVLFSFAPWAEQQLRVSGRRRRPARMQHKTKGSGWRK